MRFRHHDPHHSLRHLVQGYWELEDLYLPHPVQNADLPEGTLRLLFSAEAVLVGSSVQALRAILPVTLTPFNIQSQGSVMQGQLRILVAELYPWAAKQLLGWSAGEPSDQLDAALSASSWGQEVVALLGSGEWTAAREALETRLLELASFREELGIGVQAAQQIYRSPGTVRVAELAETLNVSLRTLERQFVQQVGIGAKTLARVVRFNEVNTRIQLNPAVPMAELTYTLGFFDQAHFIHEFKALSNMTPGAFATFVTRYHHNVDLTLLKEGKDVFVEPGLPPGFGLEEP